MPPDGYFLQQATAARRNLGKSEAKVDRSYLDKLLDRENIEVLEHKVETWKKKYKDGIVWTGKNPYL